MRRKNRDTALVLVDTLRAASSATSSSSVMSALAATRALSQSACASNGERRPPRCGFGPARPSARNTAIHFTAVDGSTSNTFAWLRAERPCSTDRINRPRKSCEYAIVLAPHCDERRINCFAPFVNPRRFNQIGNRSSR